MPQTIRLPCFRPAFFIIDNIGVGGLRRSKGVVGPPALRPFGEGSRRAHGKSKPLDTYEGDMARKALIILGMHRSGTSALAGSLSYLGIDLGSRLLGASHDNANGHSGK